MATHAPTAAVGISADDISGIVAKVDAVVEDLMNGSKSLQGDTLAALLGGLGLAAEVGWMPSSTGQILAASATILFPTVWRLLSRLDRRNKANVKQAAISAAVAQLR